MTNRIHVPYRLSISRRALRRIVTSAVAPLTATGSTTRSTNRPTCLLLAVSLASVLGLVTAGPANATISFLNAWGTGGTGNSQFNTPIGVGIDPWNGDVLIVDQQNDRVQRFDGNGNYLDQWSFSGTPTALPGGNAWDIEVSSLINENGRVYVTGPLFGNTTWLFESDGTYVSTVAPGTQNAKGIEFNASGSRRYVAGNDLEFRPESGSGFEFPFYSALGTPALDVGVSTTGNVYTLFNDLSNNSRIGEFAHTGPTGQFLSHVSTNTLTPPTGVAQLDFTPTGLDVSADDHVFVVDQFSGVIQKYDTDLNLIDTFGGAGSTDGLFDSPTQIEVSSAGFIYVTDTGNNRVQRFFDSDAWASGTAYFDDPATGPVDVSIGSGQILGNSQIVGHAKGLTVGGTTEIVSDGRLDILGDASMFSTGDVDNDGLFNVLTSNIDLGTGLHNTGDVLFVGTTVTGAINSPAGSAINVIGQVNFLDPVSGAGGIFGSGTAVFNGGYSPGDSPAIVPVENSIAFGSTNTLSIELGGLVPGEFDQMLVGEDASLDGFLDVSLLNPFLLSSGYEFLIMDIAGTTTGQFIGLGEGDLVGTYGGEDLFISYLGGDGNDVLLFSAAVPEPTTAVMGALALCGLGVIGWRRRRAR